MRGTGWRSTLNKVQRALSIATKPISDAMLGHWVKQSGRSWWQARYLDGRVLNEWDTCADFENPTSSRWEEIDKKGMVGLRLLCPNGQIAELEAPEGHRFIQLKQSFVMAGRASTMLAHIIGVVEDNRGTCRCWIYEPAGQKIDGSIQEARIFEHWDNVRHMRYGGIGPLSLEVQGLRI